MLAIHKCSRKYTNYTNKHSITKQILKVSNDVNLWSFSFVKNCPINRSHDTTVIK